MARLGEARRGKAGPGWARPGQARLGKARQGNTQPKRRSAITMSQKALPWFRFYADWLENPKLCNVSETFQARYMKLLCLRCKGEIPGLSTDQVAWCLRLSVAETEETLAALEAAGLWIDGDIYNWDNRQYTSGTSTDRVRKHREKVKQVKRYSNVSETLHETPSESESDTESDTERERRGSHSHLISDNSDPATKKQIAFAESVLKKHGLTISSFQQTTGREGRLTSQDVDVILRDYIEAPSKEEKAKQATEAKAEQFNKLKAEMLTVFEAGGRTKALEFIRKQEKQFQAGLSVHLPDSTEATG